MTVALIAFTIVTVATLVVPTTAVGSEAEVLRKKLG
jgi:hypothetical protein